MTAKEIIKRASEIQDGDLTDSSKICRASEYRQVPLDHNDFLMRAAQVTPWPKEQLVKAQRIVAESLGWPNMFGPGYRQFTTDQIRQNLARLV